MTIHKFPTLTHPLSQCRTLNDGSGGLQEDYDVAGGRARAIRVACVEQFFSESHLKSGHFGNLVRKIEKYCDF